MYAQVVLICVQDYAYTVKPHHVHIVIYHVNIVIYHWNAYDSARSSVHLYSYW